MGFTCKRCILDSGFPGITFDTDGVCNYCHEYDEIDKKFAINPKNKNKLDRMLKKIRDDGKGQEYDCIMGVSGGRDSSYTLYLLKEWGLRPLAVHYDNNMDSKIAAENIKNACNKLDVDLFTFVVDWDEYKDLQVSFLKASVPSVDIPSDHAFITVLCNTACEQGVRYIFNGGSFRTEGYIPPEWSLHNDEKFLFDILEKFGTTHLKNFPIRGLKDMIRYKRHGITMVQPLNYVEYIHENVEKILSGQLLWKYYGGHHFENIFTRWAFGFLLPVKFKIDKRITDYAVLVRSGQLSREDAIRKMSDILYTDDTEREDRRYIMNKLDISADDMQEIVDAPLKSNMDYNHHNPMEKFLFNRFRITHF